MRMFMNVRVLSCLLVASYSSIPTVSGFALTNNSPTYRPLQQQQQDSCHDGMASSKEDYDWLLEKSNSLNRRDFSKRVALVTTGGSMGWMSSSKGGSAAVAVAATKSAAAGSSVLLDSFSDAGKVDFPLASFGLQVYDDEKAYKLTLTALEVGYRNFFASVLARNQKGFARAVKDSGIDRKELFICGSVVSNRASGYKDAYSATTNGWKQNMDIFTKYGDIDYLDQIMLDYPGPDCESIRGQWAAFQDMHSQKLVKTLSVSNFSPDQLDCLLVNNDNLSVKPVVNQLPFSVAYHPSYPQGLNAQQIIKANADRGVLVQAWAPLGYSLGGKFTQQIKDVCAQIGKPYNKSYAQVALRWLVQTGASFTCQTTKKSHFIEDLDIYDFTLSPQDMDTLDKLYA